MVKISFESSDPVFAAQVANKIADTYIISHLDSRMEMGEKATDWLGERLTQLKLKLEESQNKLLTYREENGLIDIEGSVGKLTEQEIGIITSGTFSPTLKQSVAFARVKSEFAADCEVQIRKNRLPVRCVSRVFVRNGQPAPAVV